jgi:hypothetical protein
MYRYARARATPITRGSVTSVIWSCGPTGAGGSDARVRNAQRKPTRALDRHRPVNVALCLGSARGLAAHVAGDGANTGPFEKIPEKFLGAPHLEVAAR